MNIAKILLYLALILGFVASLFFLFFLVTAVGSKLMEGKVAVIPLLLMMLLSIGGFVLELSKPRAGALLMVAGGFCMFVYLVILGGMGEIKMSLIFGVPFLLPGLIFYFLRQAKKTN
ncbi:MAG: hypothetical protein WCR72_10090 [Bacteroidota bacterium]